MELIYFASITILGIVCYLQGETVKKQRKQMADQASTVWNQYRTMEYLRDLIAKENRAKMELYRTLAKFPAAAGVICKIQCLEQQVYSLRRLLYSRQRNLSGKN